MRRPVGARTAVPVKVGVAICLAIYPAIVIGQQAIFAGLGIGIPYICLGTHFGRPDRLLSAAAGLVLAARNAGPVVSRGRIVRLPAVAIPPGRCARLIITGTDNPGSLLVVTVEIVIALTGGRPASVTAALMTSTFMVTSSMIPVAVTVTPIPSVPIVPRPVTARPPMTVVPMMPVVVVMPVTTRIEAHAERPPTPAQTKVPTGPGIVADCKPPGAVTGIVIVG